MTILNSSQTEHIICWSKWFMYCFVGVWIILRTSFRSLEYSKKLLYELSVLWAPHVPVARRDDARMSCFSPFSSSSSLALDSIVAFMWKRLDHEHLRWAFVLLYFQSDYQYCKWQHILYLFCDALSSNYFICLDIISTSEPGIVSVCKKCSHFTFLFGSFNKCSCLIVLLRVSK